MSFLRRAKRLIPEKSITRVLWHGRPALIIILVFLSMPLCVFAQDNGEPEAEPKAEPELDIEEMRRRITGEAPGEIMAFSLWDSNVSLFFTGSWKGELQGNAGFSVSPLGTVFAAPETPLLYKQEVDLTMSLWINDRWFVQANFLDEFAKGDFARNTYRAGFQGRAGEFLQYAGIGNTGLDFPSFPYLDFGGNSPSSLGLYSRFENDNSKIHILLRYDAASREERVFSGGRERTYTYIQPENSLRGISFVLPDINIDSEITVYIEDEKGTVRDSNGRRWRIAGPSEYAAGKAQGLLDLSARSEGMIAVSYSKGGNTRPWLSSMGNYSGSDGEYLYAVQQRFGGIDLAGFPQSGGGSSRPGEVSFAGVYALVVREPGTFSPFERRSRYDAPSSASEQAELVSLSSGKSIGGYDLVLLDANTASADLPLYTAAVSRRGVYELLPQGNFSLRDPRLLWPLADEYPEIYLPSAGVFTGDITLRFTNYSNQSGYHIGTDVVPGSIQVWRSGIQDTNFSYNSSSGEVTIYGPVGYNENIRITYLRISSGTRLGSFVMGIGAVYGREESPFSAQAAIGLRTNLTGEDSFTEEDLDSTGTVGLGAKVQWDFDFFKASITTGLALVQGDTTGLYRAAGMEGNETVLALPSQTSFLSHPPSSALASGLDLSNRAGLIYRNYNSNSVLGDSLMYIERDAPVVSGIDRPYPVRDSQLGDTQVLAAEFTLDNAQRWTGFQAPLDYSTGLLSRATEIEIPYRFYGFSGNTANFRLIIQIGALSGKDFAFTENPDLVWEKEIFPSGGTFDTNAHIARFSLSDDDRLKLTDARYLRVIAVFDDSVGESVSGRVLIAPPIIRGASFRAVTFDGSTVKGSSGFSSPNNRVTALETLDTGAASLSSAYSEIIRRLHPTTQVANNQRVMRINWENMEAGLSAGIDGRIGELPLVDYRELSFFVRAPDNTQGAISFIVADGPQSVSNSRLVARLPLSAFRAGQWSKVTIRYQGNGTGVFVDGARVADAFLSYRPDRSRTDASAQAQRSDYVAVFISPDISQKIDDGTIYIDEIILEDPLTVLRANAGAGIEYSRPGTFLSIGSVPVLADFSVRSAVESEIQAEGEGDELQARGSAASRTGAAISLFGINISGNFYFTAAEDTFLWSADHKISREIGRFYIEESFYASPQDDTAHHNVNLSFSSDFYASLAADALYEFSSLKQKWNLGMGYRSQKDFIPSIVISAEALWTGREQVAPDEGYGELWVSSWEPLVPDLGEGADSRKTQTQIVITQRSRPVGAVVTLEGGSNFSGANSLTVLENSSFLDIPLVFNRFSLNLRAGRSFKRHLYFSGNDALDDGKKFFESVNDSLSGWTVFPGYSLFAPELADAVYGGLDNSPSADIALYSAFTDHFSANVVLPNIYNFASFFIPSRAALRLERILEQKLDTRVDMLNLSGSLGFSTINMFGALGYRPLFNFYQTDEFTHAIEAAVIIPVIEDVSWRMRSVLGAGFRGFSDGTLNLVNTLTINSDGYWLESLIADWTVPVKKSLLGVFYDWIAAAAAKQSSWLTLSSLLNQDYEQLRTESLELAFDKTGEYLRWTVTAAHEETVRILGRLNFTVFIKLRCSQDFQSEVFTFDALLGTTLRVSF
jgi:hypothetical protein